MSHEELKKSILIAEMELERAQDILNELKQKLAEETAIAWVSYFTNNGNGRLDERFVGYKVIPISREVPPPFFITALLKEEFSILTDDPESFRGRGFGEVRCTSMEISDTCRIGTGWYDLFYAVCRTKEEAESAECDIRRKNPEGRPYYD